MVLGSCIGACPVCGGEPRPIGVIAGLRVAECGSCGLCFCVDIPPSVSPSAGDRSTETDECYTQNLLFQSDRKRQRYEELAAHRFAYYRALVGPRPRILEVGCGTAGLAQPLTLLGAEYVGVDLDHRVIAHAPTGDDISVFVADVFDMNEHSGFDVVIASQVLEHVIDPVGFASHLASLLRPGGILHLDVPNHASLAGLPSRWCRLGRKARFGGIVPPHHCFSYRSSTLKRLLSPWFDARVFTADSLDPCFGQVGPWSRPAETYFHLSRRLRIGNLLVAIGTRRVDRASPSAHLDGAL